MDIDSELQGRTSPCGFNETFDEFFGQMWTKSMTIVVTWGQINCPVPVRVLLQGISQNFWGFSKILCTRMPYKAQVRSGWTYTPTMRFGVRTGAYKWQIFLFPSQNALFT